MNRKLLALAVAGMLSVSATEAKAGGTIFHDFGMFCGGNNFDTCAAVQLSVSGTTLQMDVVNLSGFMGTPENTVYVAIGLNGLGITGTSNLEVKLVGGAWQDASNVGWSLDSGNFDAGFDT
ncbi:MAG: hypothetical protein R3324_14600, partial [Halobacteriales archaeon]|nr:hypothetical protein [Halobacteriales archaeon]